MIEPKSLRIGNTVNCLYHNNDSPDPVKFNVPVTIAAIQNDSLTLTTGQRAEIEFFSGIPLSEDELIRLGFVYNECSEHGFNEWAYPKKYNFKIGKFNGEGYLIDSYDSMPAMQYVHQLQNLFFVLTGEELTYISPVNQKPYNKDEYYKGIEPGTLDRPIRFPGNPPSAMEIDPQ